MLVVGGSSGIGRGIARAFLQRGAEVSVWGTRAKASAHELDGMSYAQIDVSDASQVEGASLPPALNVAVLCQGTVLYDRQEFEIGAFRRVVEVNLNSMIVNRR